LTNSTRQRRFRRPRKHDRRSLRGAAETLALLVAVFGVWSDAGFGELRRLLTYKTTWAGSRLVQADAFLLSSKTCSACGIVIAKLPLSARVFCCESCGLRIDRDLNAARNLAALVTEVVAGSGPDT
jgi:putative transposase